MSITNPITLFVIAGAFSLLVGLALVTVMFYLRRNSVEVAQEEQLLDLLDYDSEVKPKRRTNGLLARWNTFWAGNFREMGWAAYNEEHNKAGRDVALIGFAGAVILSLLFQNAFAGVFIMGTLIAGMGGFMRSRSLKKAEAIDELLSSFLSSLKAHIQAKRTDEAAFVRASEEMPSPLYEELEVPKRLLQASAGFEEAMKALRAKTASRSLSYLAACMIQASYTGTNLEDQIDVIRQELDEKRRRNGMLSTAVKEAMPAVYTATGAIPAGFIFTYVFNPNARDFWFVNPLSYPLLLLVGALYFGGVYFSRRFVTQIKNL